jgi:hypothetical protein
MAKQSPAVKKDNDNLVIAVAGTVLISAACAIFTAYIIDDILTSMASAQNYALIIVKGDGPTSYVSDDGKLGDQLTQATMTLRSCLDISVSLAVGTLLIGGGLIYRLIKRNPIR